MKAGIRWIVSYFKNTHKHIRKNVLLCCSKMISVLGGLHDYYAMVIVQVFLESAHNLSE